MGIGCGMLRFPNGKLLDVSFEDHKLRKMGSVRDPKNIKNGEKRHSDLEKTLICRFHVNLPGCERTGEGLARAGAAPSPQMLWLSLRRMLPYRPPSFLACFLACFLPSFLPSFLAHFLFLIDLCLPFLFLR